MTEVIFRDTAGNLPEIQRFDELKELTGYAIGHFKDGGTGFIVNLDSEILIATAAHIFVEDFEYNPNPKKIYIGHRKFYAKPLKSSIDWKDPSKVLIDPQSTIPLSIPEDWTLCTLSTKVGMPDKTSLVALEVLRNTSVLVPGCPVRVIGFANKISYKNSKYCCPSATGTEINALIKNPYLSRKQPIFFNGNIVQNGDIVCANCCSLTGMSGGPLLVQEGNKYYVIGLLHGSRPTLIHHLTASLLVEISEPKLIELIRILEEKLEFAHSFGVQFKIDYSLKKIKAYLSGICPLNILKKRLDSLYDDANYIEEELGNPVSYNVFISSSLFSASY